MNASEPARETVAVPVTEQRRTADLSGFLDHQFGYDSTSVNMSSTAISAPASQSGRRSVTSARRGPDTARRSSLAPAPCCCRTTRCARLVSQRTHKHSPQARPDNPTQSGKQPTSRPTRPCLATWREVTGSSALAPPPDTHARTARRSQAHPPGACHQNRPAISEVTIPTGGTQVNRRPPPLCFASRTSGTVP